MSPKFEYLRNICRQKDIALTNKTQLLLIMARLSGVTLTLQHLSGNHLKNLIHYRIAYY